MGGLDFDRFDFVSKLSSPEKSQVSSGFDPKRFASGTFSDIYFPQFEYLSMIYFDILSYMAVCQNLVPL